MANHKKLLIAFIVIGLAGAWYFLGRRPAPRNLAVGTGSVAPDFTLPQLNGDSLTLSAFRGKVVLLDFWATWCAPCRAETPHFVDLQEKYGSSGLQIIGVSMDDGPEPVRDFYREFKMNYPVVMGGAKTGELYGGILGLPVAMLIGRDGRIHAKIVGETDISALEKQVVKLLELRDQP